MPLLLPTRNPLAYPGGAPGFDPSHPAARGIGGLRGVSAVAMAAGFVDLTNGQPGAKAGTPVAAMLAGIGPATDLGNAGSRGWDFTGRFVETRAQDITYAGFVQPTSLGSAGSIIGNSQTAGTGCALEIAVTTGLLQVGFRGVGTTTASTVAVTINTPYFVAASVKQNTGGFINFVSVNLLTGAVLSEQKSSALQQSATPADGTIRIGSNPSVIATKYIAAGMMAPTLLSLPQLLQWAADPWSFWYPRRKYNLVGAAAGGSFPWWAVRNNQFVIGSGVQ